MEKVAVLLGYFNAWVRLCQKLGRHHHLSGASGPKSFTSLLFNHYTLQKINGFLKALIF
jgi:hypothetical protein